MKYLNALLGILCLIILLPSCLKSYVDNIQDENPVSKSNKAGVSKSSLDTFLVFSDTSALISTMADLENQSDSVLSAFEDSYSFVSMRKFYEDKLDNATDTFEQNRWEDRPVEMNEFATVVSPSGLIQLEDTLYLVDVEGGALYFTQNITSSGISQLKSKAVSDPSIDSIHLGHFEIQGLFCSNEDQAPHIYAQEGWEHYMVNGTDYRYKTRLSYNDYGLWFAVVTRFKHRRYENRWVKDAVPHYFQYQYIIKIRCANGVKTKPLITSSTLTVANRSETLYSHIRSLSSFDIYTNHYFKMPGSSTFSLSPLHIQY